MKGSVKMARYEFTKELETGNSVIDGEHRELIAAVNKLLDACKSGKGMENITETVRFLNDYVDRHFGHEEQLQKQGGYPGYVSHKAFHEGYKKTLKEITAAITAASNTSFADLTRLNNHVAVLITHIRTEDKKLAAFLSK